MERDLFSIHLCELPTTPTGVPAGRSARVGTVSPVESCGELLESALRRIAALLSVLAIPFHRAFRDERFGSPFSP